MFALDRRSALPLTDQIEARMRGLIDSGQLPPGAKLPSIRALAAQLEVSPHTVVAAYDRLVAMALVESRAAAGFFVRAASELSAEDTPLSAAEEQDPVWLAQQAHDLPPHLLPASSGALPVSWMEDAIPATLVQRAIAKSEGGMALRCPPQGLPAVRERLALLMRGQGIAVDASRVLTTYGGTQAIDLLCRAFVRPGDTVLVDDPGYFLLLGRLRTTGARILGVPRRPDGPDVEIFETLCREHRPRLFFVQGALHNPTGWGSRPAVLHRLLSVAERYDVLLAEDDVQGHFHPGQPTRLAQLSGLAKVVYYSSFCKCVSPALRMGYVAAEPALLKPLLREKICATLTTGALNELVLLELLASGRFRKQVDRIQKKLAAARVAALRQLGDAGIAFDEPAEGGMFLWGRVPEGTDIDLLAKDAYRNGLLLARGGLFTVNGRSDRHLRFNIAYSQHPALVRYLGERLSASAEARALLARMGQP